MLFSEGTQIALKNVIH